MKHILILLASCWCMEAYSQKALDIQGVKVDEQHIFFLVENNQLKYFVGKQENKRPVGDQKVFSLKENFSNLYFKWKNPLRFRYTWKDSTVSDERDQAIKDFVGTLAGQFGTAVTGLGSNKGNNNAAVAKAKGTPAPNNKSGDTTVSIEARSFNDDNLTLLFILLRSSQGSLKPSEIAALNSLSKELESLDGDAGRDIPAIVNGGFKELYEIDDPSQVPGKIALAEAAVKHYEESFLKLQNDIRSILSTAGKLEIADPMLNSYVKNIIVNYGVRVNTIIAANTVLVEKLKPVIAIMKNSVEDESTHQRGYFRIRDISFGDGKKLETVFTVKEFEYRESGNQAEFKEKNEIARSTIVFRRYDRFAISVSTGLFYSSSRLRGFGVSNSNNSFTVSEDDIERNSPVSAIFLNFNFGADSRYLSPLLQIGVDPTKRRPFLLIGGGFSIPAARLAISGGPLWTWEQRLDKLSPGSTITSTTELEKDIQYKFEVEPKGWYLGIQYNF